MQDAIFLEIDLNLPDYTNQLEEARNYINEIKIKLQETKKNKKLPLKTYETLYDSITKALLYVGTLSMPAFNIEEKIEDTYLEIYKDAPELGKKLWLDHYGEIHRPYNVLKNRLFRMFEELDEQYILYNKEHPPQL